MKAWQNRVFLVGNRKDEVGKCFYVAFLRHNINATPRYLVPPGT